MIVACVNLLHLGAPVVLSNPHFLFCDVDTVKSVKGISPDRHSHESHLNIEPVRIAT